MTNTTALRASSRSFSELNAWHASYQEEILEPALPIVDPHHHAWLDGRGRYVFDDLAADVNSGHNVLATVIVQSGENMYRANGPAEMKSVGEVEFINGIAAMAASGTVAVLLPGAYYFLRDTHLPPVAALRAAGVPMAIASDHNPGSSPGLSLLLMLNMACTLFRLTPEEALRGVTVHAARALGLKDRGQLMAGQRADFCVWDVAHPNELAYWFGLNPCKRVIVGAQEREL